MTDTEANFGRAWIGITREAQGWAQVVKQRVEEVDGEAHTSWMVFPDDFSVFKEHLNDDGQLWVNGLEIGRHFTRDFVYKVTTERVQ